MDTQLLVVVALVVVGTVLLISVLGSLYRKVGPNRALIVYGRGGTKIVVGGGTLVIPLFQKSEEFNLELMSFDVAPNFALYTNQGLPLTVEAITQLKVENDAEKIKRAANQFLSKSEADRELMVRQVMEGHLRGIVGQLTVEQLVKDPELVSARMRETVASDLDKLGLEVVSFTLKDVKDDSSFIQNMSRPEIARNRQMAEIAEAEAARNVAIRTAETQRESAQARAKADQDRVLAEALSHAAQAEAQRDLEVKQADYQATIAGQKAQADQAYDIQSRITEQRQVEETTKVTIIQKQQEVKIQQAEAERRVAELLATVQKPAEAEAGRMRIMAEAQRQRDIIEAEGRAKAVVLRLESEAEGHARGVRLLADADASAILARGQAEATALRARGMAEAESLRAKGEAEADALHRRVAALNSQNQAAILDTALGNLPQIAHSLMEAYGRIGNVTYVASGQGEGVTARISQELVGMVPMLGAVVESATGLKLRDLLGSQGQATPPVTPATPTPTATVAATVAPPVVVAPEVIATVTAPENGKTPA